MKCPCAKMFVIASRLDSMVARGWGGGMQASVRVILPPFWGGKPAYQISVGGAQVKREVVLRRSAKHAYHVLRAMLREARHAAGLPGDRAGWGGSL